MGGKKGVSSLGPALARGAPDPRGRRRQLIHRYDDAAEYSRDQSTRLCSLCLMGARLHEPYLIEPGRSRRSNERDHNPPPWLFAIFLNEKDTAFYHHTHPPGYGV